MGESRYGTRVVLKNINSLRNVDSAIECETVRQSELVSVGERLQETRLWDADRGTSYSMRSTE